MSKVIIEIHKPWEKSKAKFVKAVEILSKATGIKLKLDKHSHKHVTPEATPYKSLHELDLIIKANVEDGLSKLLKSIIDTWYKRGMLKAMGGDSFKLNGKTFINPKTGRLLTVKDWKLIAADLDRVFSFIYENQKEFLVKKAIALGKVLQTMEPAKRIATGLGATKVDTFLDSIGKTDDFRDIIEFAEIHTGELIQDMTSKSRRAVVETIIQSQQDRVSEAEIETRLLEKFGELNRDWRRISETETATNFNNGYLRSEKRSDKTGEPIYMKGISSADACPWCLSQIDNQVVVLLDNPPAQGESTIVDGKVHTAIWPGKTNVGRNQKNWWVASGSQHPHCRCSWTRYFPDMEKYEKKLRDALAAATAAHKP